MNDPKNWSAEVRLRGDELSLLLDGLDSLAATAHYPDGEWAKSIKELHKKLTSKWEANA